MTSEMIDYLFCGIYLFVLIAVYLLSTRIDSLKRQITDLRIRELIFRKEEAQHFKMLLGQIKTHGNQSLVVEELQQIFSEKANILRKQYPQLTNLDIQVLILIGLGVDNHEILTFTGMSKRTYYKRRQLIAQRIGTTAAQLNEAVKQIFNPKQ